MTQKDLISDIRKEQKEFALQFDVFMRKQDLFNQRMSNILENDAATNKKGLVDKVGDIDNRVNDIEVKSKITAGKLAIGLFLISLIGGVVWKLISYFD